MSKLKTEYSKIFIFADDITKAKEMFLGEEFYFVEDKSPCEQIAIMSSCDDFVISNSTFSWWGAFLGKKKKQENLCTRDLAYKENYRRWFIL